MLKELYKKVYLTDTKAFFRKIFRVTKYKKNYNNMKNYKEIHKGQRCFIIATGPSLTIEDIEMLQNEKTFCMNSGLFLLDKCSWKPTYYVSQDKEVYAKLKKDIKRIDERGIVKFIGDTATQRVLEKDVLYTIKLYDHLLGGHQVSFSNDCYKYISDGWTVTYSTIQLAVYMGFTEIYLLGCDSNYMGKQLHSPDCLKAGEKETRTKGTEYFGYYSNIAYECAKKFADEHGVKIINVTRGGKLEVFPRMNLGDVLKNGHGGR